MIILVHSLSTINNLDSIVVTDGGKMIKEGTCSQLMSKANRRYKSLWKL